MKNSIRHRFEDTVIEKIDRIYSKEESIAFLLKEIKELKFAHGEMISQYSEMEDQLRIEKNKNEIKAIPDAKISNIKNTEKHMEGQHVESLKETIKMLCQKKGEVQKELKVWQNKYFSQLAITTQLINSQNKVFAMEIDLLQKFKEDICSFEISKQLKEKGVQPDMFGPLAYDKTGSVCNATWLLTISKEYEFYPVISFATALAMAEEVGIESDIPFVAKEDKTGEFTIDYIFNSEKYTTPMYKNIVDTVLSIYLLHLKK